MGSEMCIRDRVGLRGQFFGRDAVDRDVEAAIDQRIQPFGQLRFFQRGLGQVEIDAGGIGRNAAPGHRRGHQRTQQMQTGVQAHQPMAARPVDCYGDAVADLGGGVAVQHVQDALAVVGVDGVRQRQDCLLYTSPSPRDS